MAEEQEITKERTRPKVPEAAEAPPPEPPKRSFIPPKKYLVIGGVVLVQLVASYFLQKTLFFDVAEAGLAETEEVEGAHEEEEGDGHGGVSIDPVIVMLDEIVVNPAGTEGRRYLATRIGLQSRSATAEPEITGRAILIRDAVISLLSSKSMNQLSDLAYRDSLRVEIRTAINLQLKDAAVENVVFADYVLN